MGAAPSAGIRWDRISRYGLLVVFVFVAYLYISPARSYISTRREASHRQAQVRVLEREHARLERRRKALSDPHVVETEARKLGMIMPGEHPYVVRGLPRGDG